MVIEQISMNPSDSLVILTSSFKKFCLKYTLMRENFLPIVILAKGHWKQVIDKPFPKERKVFSEFHQY